MSWRTCVVVKQTQSNPIKLNKQRVLTPGHQGWNDLHSLCRIGMEYYLLNNDDNNNDYDDNNNDKDDDDDDMNNNNNDNKQRVLMHRHQGWNVRHGLCHIYMRYIYIYELLIAFVCFVVCSLL